MTCTRQCHAVIATILSVALSAGGCTQTYKKKVASFHTENEEGLVGKVPMTGVYQVRWARGKGKDYHGVDGTEMLLYRGQSAGFETDDDGSLVAVGAERRIALTYLPDDAKYLVWYHKSKRKTHFGREVDEALDVAGKVAGTTAIVVGGAAVLVGSAYLQLLNSDHQHHRDCRCD